MLLTKASRRKSQNGQQNSIYSLPSFAKSQLCLDSLSLRLNKTVWHSIGVLWWHRKGTLIYSLSLSLSLTLSFLSAKSKTSSSITNLLAFFSVFLVVSHFLQPLIHPIFSALSSFHLPWFLVARTLKGRN